MKLEVFSLFVAVVMLPGTGALAKQPDAKDDVTQVSFVDADAASYSQDTDYGQDRAGREDSADSQDTDDNQGAADSESVVDNQDAAEGQSDDEEITGRRAEESSTVMSPPYIAGLVYMACPTRYRVRWTEIQLPCPSCFRCCPYYNYCGGKGRHCPGHHIWNCHGKHHCGQCGSSRRCKNGHCMHAHSMSTRGSGMMNERVISDEPVVKTLPEPSALSIDGVDEEL